MNDEHRTHLLQQPRAVWAVAFASVVAFMGIGLVDPILPTLAQDLDATPSQVSLLFTSYFAMTGVSMLVGGWVSSRIGPRRTLLAGLVLVVLFSALAGTASSIGAIAGFRLGWGLGNAHFIATALAVIVGAASGGLASAIVLFEAALGLGIAAAAARRAAGRDLVARAVLRHRNADGDRLRVDRDAARPRAEAGAQGGVLRADPRAPRPPAPDMAIVAVLYNFGFFTLLAYTPFPLGLGIHQLGLVFFGWGLLLALTSVSRLSRSSGGSGSCRRLQSRWQRCPRTC